MTTKEIRYTLVYTYTARIPAKTKDKKCVQLCLQGYNSQ